MQLKARPCERHLWCHDNSGGRGEQEEAFAVWLQAPGTTQSERRSETVDIPVMFPCRDNKKAPVEAQRFENNYGVPLSKALDSQFVQRTNNKPILAKYWLEECKISQIENKQKCKMPLKWPHMKS